MLSKLKEFQQEMIKYTETVASVLDVDIEIVDDRLIRISGTGLYKSKINESVVTVQVAQLPKDAVLEIEAMAVL
ncbi:sigma54-dependent transcriptional regulator [Clostridioides difficile]|nr:sigma54-dependent transcriptional regulator [Clostridioides difficile]